MRSTYFTQLTEYKFVPIECGARIQDTDSLAPESGERVAPTGALIIDKDSGSTPSLLA